jgi:hypothetical protein
LSPPGPAPAHSFSVTDTIQNLGSVSAGASTTRYYLSLNSLKDAGDISLAGSRAVGILSPSGTSTGTVAVDVRHDPRAGETCVVVSACRAQRLAVESVDPEGVYRVQVDDEPASHLMPRTVRPIQALLSTQRTGDAIRTRRTRTPGVMTVLEVPIAGNATGSSSASSASRRCRPPRQARRGRRFWLPSPPAPGEGSDASGGRQPAAGQRGPSARRVYWPR